jgi:protoporphyrinogen IX oxidase
MILAELYPWIKAIHVAAALTFGGGVLAVAVFFAAVRVAPGYAKSLGEHVRCWDRLVTTPAMLLVWALGLLLASAGHWFGAGWLNVKLCLVVLLSGIHGVQSGYLRRLSGGAAGQPWRVAPLILILIVAIAILVVVKPF